MELNTGLYSLPQDERLETSFLSHLFDNMSECYKLFWFQAIVNEVSNNHHIFTYDNLINNMIADAWYMVSEYKLNLGPADTLEALVHHVCQISGLKSSEKKENILTYLQNSDDIELKKKKRTLTLNVPYRLQAPFMHYVKGKEWNVSETRLAEKINQEERLMYYFVQITGLQSQIEMTQEWFEYIYQNQEILRGWISYKMISYLQKRNPNVPGIVNKLNPPQERKLDKVKKYWKMVSEVVPVRDIYADEILKAGDISIDHFVPWSYVAHDELWNLSPTTRSANSSKSNNLPVWDIYFPKLCRLEYLSYQSIWKYDKVHDEFQRCGKEHVNSNEVRVQLYQKGLNEEVFNRNLEEVLLPIYQSAHNMGFREWKYGRKDVRIL